MTHRSVHPKSIACACAMLVAGCALTPAAAQYEDDALDDHERQDQRYLERYERPAEEEETPTESGDARSVAEAFIALADELIRDKSYMSHTTERFRVQTDDPRLDPKAAVTLLETFRPYFERFWEDTVELKAHDVQSRVFLFYSFYKYNQLLDGDWRFSDVRPKGHYKRGVNAITLHTDADATPDLADAMIHEATHQLVEERIYVTDAFSSPWISEGLATYFGYTYMDRDRRFLAGEIGGKTIALMRGGPRGPGREGRDKLQDLKRAMKSKSDGPTFVEVVRIQDPRVFYGQSQWTYAASWVLVHFLLHGEDGAHRDAFGRYITLESRGQGGPGVFYRELGMSDEELEAAANAYLKGLKSH